MGSSPNVRSMNVCAERPGGLPEDRQFVKWKPTEKAPSPNNLSFGVSGYLQRALSGKFSSFKLRPLRASPGAGEGLRKVAGAAAVGDFRKLHVAQRARVDSSPTVFQMES